MSPRTWCIAPVVGALSLGAFIFTPLDAQQPAPMALTSALRFELDTAPLATETWQPPQDTIRRRRAAVAYSDGYAKRLTIHRYASYTMIPLFVAQYVLGSRLLGQKEDIYENRRTVPIDASLRSTHRAVAGGVAALFVVNTTTGVWNLVESWDDPNGRGRRNAHAISMLAADAGFVATGVLGSRATTSGLPPTRTHRNVALASFGVATAGASLMWFGNR